VVALKSYSVLMSPLVTPVGAAGVSGGLLTGFLQTSVETSIAARANSVEAEILMRVILHLL